MNAVGIAQAMSQAGMPVFAQDAEMSPKDNIHTHYIRPGDLVAGESRYAHELSRIINIFEQATRHSLVLFDESCTGTSSKDGSHEAGVIFRVLGKLGATGYAATHFHDQIDIAEELPFAKNLCCVTNGKGDDLEYTYKIVGGSSRQSNGMHLARTMGADEAGLTRILTERVQSENLQVR